MNLKKNARILVKNKRMRLTDYWRYLVVLILAGVISGCASTLPPPKWMFERDAINLHIKSHSELNLKNEIPHTLLICVYQLKDPIAFERLASDTAGLYKLLECELFDASVVTSNKLFVHPDQSKNLMFDRAEGVKHVAFVAGYYTIEKERIVRLFDVPVVIEKKGFLWGEKKQKPGNLKINLFLGPKQILAAKGN